MPWSRASLVGALVLLAHAPRADAQPSSQDSALAEQLFVEGRALLERQDFRTACPKFAESQRLAPKLGTLLNLATCHEKEGKTASAWAEFKAGAALAHQDQHQEREAYAQQHVADLEARLTRLIVRVARSEPGMVVTLDGRELAAPAWGSALPIDPGDHELRATAPDRAPFRAAFNAPAGPTTLDQQIPVLLAPQGGDALPNAQVISGAVLAGVGGLSLGIGAYFGVRTFALDDESHDHCDGNACTAEGVELRDEAFTAAHASTALITIGVASAATGVVLVITGTLLGGDEAPPPVAFAPLEGGGAVVWGGRW